MEKELFIVRGLPGSGKSTTAKKLGGNHYEADMFFIDENGLYNFRPEKIKEAHQWCKSSVETAMIEKQSRIVVSNTFTEEWEFSDYQALADKHGYVVFYIVVENRHNGKNIHNVPENILTKMLNRFKIKLI